MTINEQGDSSVNGGRGWVGREADDQLAEIIPNQGCGLVSMRELGHRRLAQILDVEESDEGVPPTSLPPKQIRLPRRSPGSRA
jgi:hypothetical protein